jgi:hypothetical protein
MALEPLGYEIKGVKSIELDSGPTIAPYYNKPMSPMAAGMGKSADAPTEVYSS